MKGKMRFQRMIVLCWVGALVLTFSVAPGAAHTPGPVQEQAAQPAAASLANPLGVQFAHIATTSNIIGSNTYIRHYATDNHPELLLFVTPDVQPGGIGSYVYNDHPVGVWYSNADARWEIYNQDLFAMPAGATFHVLVVPAGANAFIQTATGGNIAGDTTYFDHPLTNNNPNARIVITQNLSPGGIGVLSNPHTTGLWYSSSIQRWGVSNLDGSPMTVGTAFNVLVFPTGQPGFTHQSAVANVAGAVTYLDYPALNGRPNAIPFITHNTSPGGVILPALNHSTGVWYDSSRSKWAVINLDLAAMPVNVAFNVLIPSVESETLVHYAAGTNIWANYTYFFHPLTDYRPHALLFTTANWNPGGSGGVYHDHPVGVYFDATNYSSWTIFNQDSASMPAGPAFNVLIPVPDAGVFVHKATAANTVGHDTYLNHPLTNGRPAAMLTVTPNFNPGGEGGVFDNHPVGVWYDGARQAWAIYNLDWAAMPAGASFNVLVAPSGPAFGSTAFVHSATVGNTSGHITYIDHPSTNNQPEALLFATFNYNPPGSPGTGNPYVTGVYYDGYFHKWTIFNQNLAAMPVGTSFNILVPNRRVALPLVLR